MTQPDNTPLPVSEAIPSKFKRRLSQTQYRALHYLKANGACTIGHGTRTLQMIGSRITMKSDAEHFLLTSGMVERAGGNYPKGFYRLSEYGEQCYTRDYRDARISVPWHQIWESRS